jgi:AcrR family transcriptional regulator
MEGSAPPLPRQRRALETRQRLMDATLDILYEEGASALSTVRIAQRAGIVQSGFYRHFAGVEDCVRAKAQQLRTGLSAPALAGVLSFHEDDPTDQARLTKVLERLFDDAIEHRKLVVLVGRHRHDQSALGETIRDMLGEAERAYTDSLWATYHRLGVAAKHRESVAVVSAIFFETVVSTMHDVVTGRYASKRMVAQTLARLLRTGGLAEFRHLAGEGEPRAAEAGTAAPIARAKGRRSRK